MVDWRSMSAKRDINWVISGVTLSIVLAFGLAFAVIPEPPRSISVQQELKSLVVIEIDHAGSGEGGSGFYIGNGLVVTARHVAVISSDISAPQATDPRNKLVVETQDGKAYPATVAWVSDDTDFALLKVSGLHAPALPISCHRPRIDEPVLVLGNPELTLKWGISRGVVASSLPVDFKDLNIYGLYGITAPVLPGNSGGPVLDEHGDVIGLVTAKMQDFGFITPMSAVCAEIPRVGDE